MRIKLLKGAILVASLSAAGFALMTDLPPWLRYTLAGAFVAFTILTYLMDATSGEDNWEKWEDGTSSLLGHTEDMYRLVTATFGARTIEIYRGVGELFLVEFYNGKLTNRFIQVQAL